MLPHSQVILTFISTCIEATSRRLGVPYRVVFDRMQRLDLINNYIYPNYETLHTESRENIANDIIECMNIWEKKK